MVGSRRDLPAKMCGDLESGNYSGDDVALTDGFVIHLGTNLSSEAGSKAMNVLGPGDRIWIDRLADRFEAAWNARQRPRIEDYLAEVEPPQRATLLEKLLALECRLRARDAESPDPEEYRVRFPEHTDI